MTTGSERLDLTTVQLRPGLLWCIEVREETSAGGIVLPDVNDAQKMRIGYCFAIGDGEPDAHGHEKRRFVRAGDYFVYGKYQSGGEPIVLNGVSILQFRQDDIAARVPGSERMRGHVARALRRLQGLPELEEVKAA